MQRPAQEFASPSGSSPDLEAMKAAQNAAIVSNERTFPVFAKKFASKDPKDFAVTAGKFAIWLSSSKAYYPAARPKIVELLEIALSAFMDTFHHHPDSAEFAELLWKIVEAVLPFKNLFVEPELQSRLERVIVDTERSLSRVAKKLALGNAPPQGVVTANSSSLAPVSSGNVHSPSIIPHTTSPIPNHQNSVLKFPPSVSSVVNVVPNGPVLSGQTNASPSLTFPVTITPQEPGGNISPSVPSKPQPKRARRAELPEELIARDFDWFKSIQAPAPVTEDLSMAGESSPISTSNSVHTSRRSPSKTARMVPSRRLPRRIPSNAQTTRSGVLPPPSEPLADGKNLFESVSAQNVSEQQCSPEKIESDAPSTAIPEVCDARGGLPHEELPPPKPQLVVALPDEPIKSAMPETHQSPRPSSQLAGTTSDRAVSMDISAEESASEGDLSTPQSPQVLQLASPKLPPLVRALGLNLDFNTSQISPSSDESSMDVVQQRFDGEMAIILSRQGKPFTHAHMIDFSLEESVFSKISKWVNRRSHPSDAPYGVCISLGCYRLSEFFDKIRSESSKPDIGALISQSSCHWPYSNRLFLHVNDEKRHVTITLSPPFFLTPDQCVDISSLLKPGNNTLEIRQQDDLSDYLVVLHAHHPTRAQLSEPEVIKIADERWKRFLDALSPPVVPGNALGTTSSSVVGVV